MPDIAFAKWVDYLVPIVGAWLVVAVLIGLFVWRWGVVDRRRRAAERAADERAAQRVVNSGGHERAHLTPAEQAQVDELDRRLRDEPREWRWHY